MPAHAGHRAADHAQHVGDRDRVGVAGQAEPALGAALGRDQPAAAQVRQDRAEELRRQVLVLGQVLGAGIDWSLAARVSSARMRVLGLSGDLHGSILPAAARRGRAPTLGWSGARPGRPAPLPVRRAARRTWPAFVAAVVAAGVDVVQLREKDAPRVAVLAAARGLAPGLRRPGASPSSSTTDPTVALESGADGVHVGQEDASVARCREILGDDALVGLSTHAPAEFAAALATSASYLSAGPIEPTPTKPGRAGTGLDYALACERASDRPVFVTGGVTAATVGGLVAAGLRHFVAVRAILDGPDPGFAARQLRDAIDEALADTGGAAIR